MDRIYTGFESLDKHLKIYKGDLVVIGSRPAIGKTSLMCSMIEKTIDKQKTLFFTMEERKDKNIEKTIFKVLDLKENNNFTITAATGNTYLSKKYLDEHEPIIYYCDLECTDKYIYALYVNQKMSEWQRIAHPTEIHVFDWNGNAVYKLKTQETLLNIDIDETGQKIYGLATEEQVFIYDIPKELI